MCQEIYLAMGPAGRLSSTEKEFSGREESIRASTAISRDKNNKTC